MISRDNEQRRRHSSWLALCLVLATTAVLAQDTEYQVDPMQSSVKFTLADVLHTVHGTFKVNHGAMRLGPGGKLSGEIVVDAASGNSGNGMRDRKMHREVLESSRYPEIRFRPERVDGAVEGAGQETVTVHGIFNIHGSDREITVPATLSVTGGRWTANVHFTVPYGKWGMKNPSTLFLRVSDSVEIDLTVAGNVVRTAAVSTQ